MTKNIFNDGSENPRVSDIHREVKELLANAADTDAEMSRKGKVLERKIEALEMALPKELEQLEKMKAECRTLQVTVRERDSKAALEVEKQLRADVHSGKIGVVQFHEQMAEHSMKTKTAMKTIDGEISEALKAVRVKGLEVLKKTEELGEYKVNFYYFMGYPTDTALTEIEKMIKEMSHRSQVIAGHYQAARAEHERAKFAVQRALGKALTVGWNADSLSLADVQGVPFNPEIPEKYLPSLAVITLEIEANEAKRTAGFQDPGQYYLTVSFMAGLTQPWSWLCRNDGSPALTMNRQKAAAGLTMSNIETKGKLSASEA